MSNLRQTGLALQLYVQENNNRFPTMRDVWGAVRTNLVPGPDRALASQLGNTNVLRCPSDFWPADTPKLIASAGPTCFDQTGCSYSWNNLLNGKNADEHFKLLGLELAPHETALFFDKEKFHRARGESKARNYLYADGHIKNLLVIEGVLPPKP